MLPQEICGVHGDAGGHCIRERPTPQSAGLKQGTWYNPFKIKYLIIYKGGMIQGRYPSPM